MGQEQLETLTLTAGPFLSLLADLSVILFFVGLIL